MKLLSRETDFMYIDPSDLKSISRFCVTKQRTDSTKPRLSHWLKHLSRFREGFSCVTDSLRQVRAPRLDFLRFVLSVCLSLSGELLTYTSGEIDMADTRKIPFTPKNKFSQQFEPSSELTRAVTILVGASMQIKKPVTFSLADPDDNKTFAVVVAVSHPKHIKQLEELIDQWQGK